MYTYVELVHLAYAVALPVAVYGFLQRPVFPAYLKWYKRYELEEEMVYG